MKNPDGTTRIIQQTVSSPATRTNTATVNSASSASTTTNVNTNTSASTSCLQNPVQHNQASANQTSNNSPHQPTSTQPPQQHKVQIIRGPDGKVSVRGLSPGQQLIQMPDGKLHVLTTTSSSSSTQGGITTGQQCKYSIYVECYKIQYKNNLHCFIFP